MAELVATREHAIRVVVNGDGRIRYNEALDIIRLELTQEWPSTRRVLQGPKVHGPAEVPEPAVDLDSVRAAWSSPESLTST